MSSLVLSLLYGSALTSIHDNWKNHSFDIRTFVGKVMSLPFNMLPSFPSKEQVSFNFMASVTVCSDFGAQESKICNNLVFPKYA